MKKHNRYVPVLIKEQIEKLNHPRPENLYCIIDLIYRKNIYYKNETQKEYGFSPIPKQSFKEILSSNGNIVNDINFLIDEGFIDRTEFSSKEAGVCKSYRIKENYLSKNVRVLIESKSINKKIGFQIEQYKKCSAKKLQYQQSRYFKTFKIDSGAALNHISTHTYECLKMLATSIGLSITNDDIANIINCTGPYKKTREQFINGNKKEFYSIIHRMMDYQMKVNTINDGFLFFKRNKTNNRLDTNLTSLPSILRPYIVADKELYSIDLKNSQPYFLYTLICNDEAINQDELNQYKELVISGNLYEWIMEKYDYRYRKLLDRKQVKELMFKIYYSQNTSYQKEKDFFASLFPTIAGWIINCKCKNYKKFAIKLQSIESHIILDIVMGKLKDVGVVPYTIHDSFICHDDEKDIIINAINDVTYLLYNCSPGLHVESLKLKEIIEPTEHNWDVLLNSNTNKMFHKFSQMLDTINDSYLSNEISKVFSVKQHWEFDIDTITENELIDVFDTCVDEAKRAVQYPAAVWESPDFYS